METVDLKDLKARHDLRKLIPPGPKYSNKERYRVQLCLWHNEDRPSLFVTQSSYFCRACGAKGDAIEWIKFSHNLGFFNAVDYLEKTASDAPYVAPARESLPPLKPHIAIDYQLNLNERALRYYHSRLLSNETIVRFRLGYGPPPGHTESWFSIPIYENEKLVNIKFRRDDGCPMCDSFDTKIDNGDVRCLQCSCRWTPTVPKYLGLKNRGTVPTLFNGLTIYQNPGRIDNVVVTEGEYDCMATNQAGFYATCSTNGVNSFNTAWIPLFTPIKNIFTVFDIDAGGESGWKLWKGHLKHVKRIDLPLDAKGADLTDYFRSHSPRDFNRLIRKSKRNFAYEIQVAKARYGAAHQHT